MRNSVRIVLLLSVATLIAVSGMAIAQDGPTKLLRAPAISVRHISFSYAGDLWIADRDGQNPRRLTVHEGYEAGHYFSPDGKWLAFSGEYDGNTDVYVVSVDGGAPKRLTYHPGSDIVRGWSPDGEVMFLSSRNTETRRYMKMYTVGMNDPWPEELVIPRISRGSFSPDGSKIAYTMVGDPFWTWKRYRGGLTPFIWIFDMASYDVVEVPRAEFTDPVTGGTTYANDTYPLWLGNTVYFLSDRDHTMNIFAYDTNTGQVSQLTDHKDYDVRSVKGMGNTLVYEQAMEIHQLDLSTGQSSTIDVHINPDLPDTRPRFESVGDMAGWYEISPTGQRGLFEARGDVWTVPTENGEPRNITNTPGVHERYPIWSATGGEIAYMSEASGEYRLHIRDQMGKEDPKTYKLGPDQFYFLISWDPDGERILYHDGQRKLFYFDVDAKRSVEVAEDRFGSDIFSPQWSPGGRYITYSTFLDNSFTGVMVYDTETKRTHQISDGNSLANNPTFSRDGKYLFFSASTDVGLLVGGSEMSSYGREMTDYLYLVVLHEDEPSPFAPESDEEEVAEDEEEDEGDDEDAEDDDEEDEEEGEKEIDFDGIRDRILPMNAGSGQFGSLQTGEGGYLFYLDFSGDSPNIMRYSMDDKEASTFLSNAWGYMVSADGNKLIYNASNYGIVDVSGDPSPGDGSLDMSGMQVRVQPRLEWEQMLHEVWRLERDFFYDEGMHGNDWDAIYDKYAPFVRYVGHRSDLNYLIGELIGELVVGHAYRWGGDMPDVDRVTVGLLGANYSVENGRYRLDKIFSGLNWDPAERSPLTEPGVDVMEGEYLLAVNGIEVTADENLFIFFQNTAGKQTVLTVNDRPTMDGAREVTVEPLRTESALRLRDWVDGNRQKVWEATNGRAAYVYVPDTAGDGYEFFTRYYFSQLDKHGVIVDERFNGGGHLADFIVDMLDRPQLNFWTSRADAHFHAPTASIYGPKVMIANESAGSGGDWLPFAFQARELGPVIGTRTWGGLVGIGGMPRLMDGGAVTVPNWAFYNLDGSWGVENYGVAPDIHVQQTPKDVINGADPQLDRAIEEINRALRSYSPRTPDPDPRPKRARQ